MHLNRVIDLNYTQTDIGLISRARTNILLCYNIIYVLCANTTYYRSVAVDIVNALAESGS